jgi:hypothetical protein
VAAMTPATVGHDGVSMTRLRDKAASRTSVRARWCIGLLVIGYFVLGVVAGAPNSPLTTPLPVGAQSPLWAVHLAKELGLDHVGRPTLTIASLVIVAALLMAFALLLVEAWSNRVRLSAVLASAGVSVAISVAAPVLLSRDVFTYAAYGRIFALYHHNPYVSLLGSFPRDPFVAVTSAQWLRGHSLYGPAFTLASAAIVRVWPDSPGAAIFAFKALAGIGVASATVCTALAARAARPERAALAAAIVGLNPVVVIHTVGGGHIDAWIAGALAGALALAVRVPRAVRPSAHDAAPTALDPSLDSPRSAEGQRQPMALTSAGVTVLLSLATLIKTAVVPALALWLWWLARTAPPRRRLRAVAMHLALVAGLSAAVLAPFRSGWQTLIPVASLGGMEAWASPAQLVARGARALIGGLFGPGAGLEATRVVVGSFVVVFAGLVWRLGRLRAASDPGLSTALDSPADGWGSALFLLALAMPYLLPWYTAWFVPFLGLMGDEVLAVIGVAVGGLLALTLIPADPPHGLSAWGVMLGVHYGVAPLMLGLSIVAGYRVARMGRGRSSTSRGWRTGERRATSKSCQVRESAPPE